MFVNDTNLPLQLRPEHYLSDDVFARERERLFRHSWQPVAPAADLARDGDFVTADVVGTPVIVRNFNGSLAAFVNVCAHRFCKLTALSRGSAPALRCQYHGWEYDETGATRKIPEAQGFRPLEKGQAALAALRVERCGEIVFVAQDPAAPSLREFLGPHFDWIETLSRHYGLQTVSKHRRLDVNWKVAIENTLESYHLPDVHRATLGGIYPEATDCSHELGPRSSTFRSRDPASVVRHKSGIVGRVLRRTGRAPAMEYVHVHVFPNLTFATSDLGFAIQWYSPSGPRSCDMHFMIRYVDPARLGLPWSVVLRRMNRRDAAFWNTVNDEDLAVLPSIQEGLASRTMPRGGLLSNREERIWHFQRFYVDVLEREGDG